MRRILSVRWILIGLALSALATSFLAGSWHAQAAPAPPSCTISCTCKEVYAYATLDPNLGTLGPYAYLVQNADLSCTATTNAMTITTTGGCMSGSVTPTSDQITSHPMGNLTAVCSTTAPAVVEYNTWTGTVTINVKLNTFARSACLP